MIISLSSIHFEAPLMNFSRKIFYTGFLFLPLTLDLTNLFTTLSKDYTNSGVQQELEPSNDSQATKESASGA